jgi:hypothetical protein
MRYIFECFWANHGNTNSRALFFIHRHESVSAAAFPYSLRLTNLNGSYEEEEPPAPRGSTILPQSLAHAREALGVLTSERLTRVNYFCPDKSASDCCPKIATVPSHILPVQCKKKRLHSFCSALKLEVLSAPKSRRACNGRGPHQTPYRVYVPESRRDFVV